MEAQSAGSSHEAAAASAAGNKGILLPGFRSSEQAMKVCLALWLAVPTA